jgi:hypothetical protein
VLEGGRVHGKKRLLKNDRYDYDKGEYRNLTIQGSKNGANKKICVVILQLEWRRHSCAEIDLSCSVCVSVPRARVCRVSIDKGFTYAIAL